MIFKFLVIFLAGYLIYDLVTRDKREQKMKQIEFDGAVVAGAVDIVSAIKDLKSEYVQVLRDGGEFCLNFRNNSVYYEEGTGENKNTKCLLDWFQKFNNTLSEADNKAVAELVYNSLSKVSWMKVILFEEKITVSKADNVLIPDID